MSEQDNSEVAFEDKMLVIWLRQSAEKVRLQENERVKKFRQDEIIFTVMQWGGFILLCFVMPYLAVPWIALSFWYAHRHKKLYPGFKFGPEAIYTDHESSLLALDAMSDRKMIEAIRAPSYSEVRRQFDSVGKH